MSDATPPSAEQIRAGDRRALARAITWVESTRVDHQEESQALLESLVGDTGGSIRVGITGPPGVGKSSFIERFGLALLEDGRRLAVLAVDPSSPISGGSILGDKTRMERLAQDPRAFIRPSPSSGSLGGVARRTRESLLLCEAAGFDVVLVETVGIGQSEIAVRSMVDFFAVLLQPGAGDELQGIKKGVLELADALVVTKADGAQKRIAERTRAEHLHALGLLRSPSPVWHTPVLTTSAVEGEGIQEVWDTILAHREALGASGELEEKRRSQARDWMWSMVEEGLLQRFRSDPEVAGRIAALEQAVATSRRTPTAAARELLDTFRKA
ncbi:MAG: methylmalonyl Co-A mutase-associated GTPase MeaB [Myxococcota bacterium]|nr:methylmalonyl Co-A mutase-associated GTPase MeaB [Myxococcota bacterium]